MPPRSAWQERAYRPRTDHPLQLINGKPVYSASDINNFTACAHLTTLDLTVLTNGGVRPEVKSKQADILRRLGEEHELAYLDRLQAAGKAVTRIERVPGAERVAALERAASDTIAAMRAGDAYIYQATFFDGTFLGHADFLRRIEEPSPNLGAWSYEVEDTKLARSAQPYFLLQLCYYSEQVGTVQGSMPEFMYVILGDGKRVDFRVSDFSAYYRAIKAEFLQRVAAAGGTVNTYPEPVKHCTLCVWDAECEHRRTSDDHLSLVAGVTRLQRTRLGEGGIATLEALGEAAVGQRPGSITLSTFQKVARQARLQLAQRRAQLAHEDPPYKYELLRVEPDRLRGFALLPKPSDGDIFFDMEGDPYYDMPAGLEYLFGAHTPDGVFTPFWGCDRSKNPVGDRRAEKQAFEAFIDFVMERRARFPDLHVYHYANYEKSALQKLAIRHGTREEQVDILLREGVLVDLYNVVRQSVVVGQPGYSIKLIEAFYGKREDGSTIKAGDESILRFEEWLASRHLPGHRDDSILDDLEKYNSYDCISTFGLHDWLLKLREEAQEQFGIEIPYFTGKKKEAEKEQEDEFSGLKQDLFAALPPEFDAESASSIQDLAIFRTLHLLEYHRREDKPVWWRFHDRCATFHDDPEDLMDDTECIVGLELKGEPSVHDRSLIYALHFPSQQLKIERGNAYDPRDKTYAGEILQIQEFDDRGVLQLRRNKKRADEPFPSTLVVRDMIPAGTVRKGIGRFARALLDGNHRYRAAYDLLTSADPRLRDREPGANVQPGKLAISSIAPIVGALDDSYLFIQGPPGSGKTYLGARLIVEQLKAGKRVGVTANSHKAINKLLDEVEAAALEGNFQFRGAKRSSDDNAFESKNGMIGNVEKDFPTDAQLVAGTVWAFSAQDMDHTIDVLFIDEAGQYSLPNAVAAATAASNVVLLGDPLQLAQVGHTKHPGNVGASVLEHLLGDAQVPVLPHRGIFLDQTWRMHQDVCAFVSETMYEGKLHPAPGRNRQHVEGPGLRGTGLRYLGVVHGENRHDSPQEAKRIADEIELMLRGTVMDFKGASREIRSDDIIVVTPYNAQVRCIRKEMATRGGSCRDVQVGTVDKFQGQEAYVVFFSTAASSGEDAPRGLEFIFDRNRLNVAVSRARALAVIVGSPALFRHECKSIEQMQTLNGALRFRELAT